ncbi:MAG: InlB B-repeat-containing protein, partial [Acetatifactor sp.]
TETPAPEATETPAPEATETPVPEESSEAAPEEGNAELPEENEPVPEGEPVSQEENQEASGEEVSPLTRLADFLFPSITVYASENMLTEEVELSVSWTLETDLSSAAAFSSENAGAVFVYVPELPEGYQTAEGIALPEIIVTIQNAEPPKAYEVLQERINALPSVEEYRVMTAEEQEAAYETAAAISDEYFELSEEEMALVDITRLEELFMEINNSLTAFAAYSVGVTFDYAYDCNRSPAFPKIDNTIKLFKFANPLDGNSSRRSTGGSWELRYYGKYDSSNSYSEGKKKTTVAALVKSMISIYQVSAGEIDVWELTESGNHICFGVAAASFPDGTVSFIGTTWSGGAGYYLCDSVLSSSDSISGKPTSDPSTGFDDLESASRNEFGVDRDDNGIISENEIEKIEKNTLIYAPSALSKDGYIFLEWNTGKGGSGTGYQPGSVLPLNQDIMLYPVWRAIESTAEVTLTLDEMPFEGQKVSLYSGSKEAYVLTEQAENAGTYQSNKVINGVYTIYVNGRNTEKQLTVAAIKDSVQVKESVVYFGLHIVTRLDGTESAKPGVVTLRKNSDVVYTPSGDGGSYTEYIQESEGSYDIFVDGNDTDIDINVADFAKTIDFYTMTVQVTDDAPWTDAKVTLQDSNGNTVAVLSASESEGNTVNYQKILQSNMSGVYSVYVDGLDSHKTVQIINSQTAELTFYTATVHVVGKIPAPAVTMTNGTESYTFKATGEEDTEKTFKAEHVLLHRGEDDEEAGYTVTVENTVDATQAVIHSGEKEVTLTYWELKFYNCASDGTTLLVRTVYVRDGDIMPPFTGNVKRSGYTFDFWSESQWSDTMTEQNQEFDFSIPITRDIELYANYTKPTVTIGEIIRTGADGSINGSGMYYRMANLTISGFDPSEESIKYIFLTTTNTESVTLLDTSNMKLENGAEEVTVNGEAVTFTPSGDKVAITFSTAISMAAAQDFLREKVIVQPTPGAAHTMIVEVADKGGNYVAVNAVTASQTTATATELTGATGGKTLYSGNYYLTRNVTYSGYYTGYNGLTIASGATVYIYIPEGVTLTATGGAGSGTTGGGAGIYVPNGATLVFLGEGTVKATGGAAGNGGNGSSGSNSGYSESADTFTMGAGGAGGKGGGGGGAGIGTSGGSGSSSYGSGGSSWSIDKDDGGNGKSGGSAYSNGTSAASMGALYYADGITIQATGGIGGYGGTGGSAGSSAMKSDWGSGINRGAAGGAGGGGGGGGYPGASIGTGGGGGGAGGGGGSAGYIWGGYYVGAGGGGAGEGYTVYRTAGGGDWSQDSEFGDDERDYDRTQVSTSGSVTSGGHGASAWIDPKSGSRTTGTGGSGGNGSYAGGSATYKSAVSLTGNESKNKKYTISFTTPVTTASKPASQTYYYGQSYQLILPEYVDSNDDVVFYGWQLQTYAKSSVNGSACTSADSTRYLAGTSITLDPSTYGNITFVAVTETVGGIRDDDNTGLTYNSTDPAATYYTYQVTVKTDGVVDKSRGNIRIGDKTVAPGADGVYTLIDTKNEAKDIRIGGVSVGELGVCGSGNVSSMEINYETIRITVTGKKPKTVTLAGEGAPSLADNDDNTYTCERLKKAEASYNEYQILVDGEPTELTAAFGRGTTVAYYTVTVNVTANGIVEDAVSTVELRDVAGHAIALKKQENGSFATTQVEHDTAYTVYVNSEKTEHTTDFTTDQTVDVTFSRYTTVIRTQLDGALFDKGTVRLGEQKLIRAGVGVYELTTENNTPAALSVDGKVVREQIMPGSTETIDYYTLTYALSGEGTGTETG